MAQNQDIPGSVRVRTDEGNEWRYSSIQEAAEYYDCNRSDAIAYACEDIVQLVAAAREVLQREDLTLEQRQEIAETMSTRAVEFQVDNRIDVEKDP